ncbi:MAG TPA: hypothetical protein VIO81_11765 [Methyloversatilis sp.]
MSEEFSDESLRRALRVLPLPAPSDELRARIVAAAPAERSRQVARWAGALVLCSLLLAVVVGVLEYNAWRDAEELARLDELSVASMLLL